MTVSSVPAPEALDTRVTGRRVVQYILDLFFAGIVLGLLKMLLNLIAPGTGFRQHAEGLAQLSPLTADPGAPRAVAVSLTVVVWLAFFVIVPILTARTPAMKLLGLRIVRVDGRPVSAGQHLGRGVLLIVDSLMAGLLGWIVILCSQQRQRIGDHAANTLVIRDS